MCFMIILNTLKHIDNNLFLVHLLHAYDDNFILKLNHIKRISLIYKSRLIY
jgi:hypothetical protein